MVWILGFVEEGVRKEDNPTLGSPSVDEDRVRSA